MNVDDSWYERPADVREHIAAGGVVARVEGERVLIVLAREGAFDTPVLPKGHVHKREDLEMAARREIEEETGFFDLTLLAELGIRERMNYNRTQWKRTHYYLFGTEQVDGVPTDRRHPTPLWADLDALPTVFWPEQQTLLDDNREMIRRVVTDWATSTAPPTGSPQ